jgi:hypothetical protein
VDVGIVKRLELEQRREVTSSVPPGLVGILHLILDQKRNPDRILTRSKCEFLFRCQAIIRCHDGLAVLNAGKHCCNSTPRVGVCVCVHTFARICASTSGVMQVLVVPTHTLAFASHTPNLRGSLSCCGLRAAWEPCGDASSVHGIRFARARARRVGKSGRAFPCRMQPRSSKRSGVRAGHLGAGWKHLALQMRA